MALLNQPSMGDRASVVTEEPAANHGFNSRGSQNQDNTQPNMPLREGNAQFDTLPGIDNGKREDASNIH
jgi:hypothetical protein